MRAIPMIVFSLRTNLQTISSMEMSDESFAVTNSDIELWDVSNMENLGINGQLISEVQIMGGEKRISWKLSWCCLTDDQMAVLCQTDEQEKLSRNIEINRGWRVCRYHFLPRYYTELLRKFITLKKLG